MFDAVAVLTNPNPTVHPSSPPPPARISFAVLHLERRLTNPSSLVDLPLNISTDLSRCPQSLQLSPVFPKSAVDHDDWRAKEMVRRTGTRARLQREKTRVQRKVLLNIKIKARSSKPIHHPCFILFSHAFYLPNCAPKTTSLLRSSHLSSQWKHDPCILVPSLSSFLPGIFRCT